MNQNILDRFKAFGYFQLLTNGVILLSFPLCYRFQPVSKFFQIKLAQTINKQFPSIGIRIQKTFDALSNNRFAKPIPLKLGLDSNRFIVALGESLAISYASYPLCGHATIKIMSSEKKVS